MQESTQAVQTLPFTFDSVAANTDINADPHAHLANGKQADDGHEHHIDDHITASTKIATLLAIILPAIGLAAAIYFSWGGYFFTHHLVMLIAGYMLTAMGITIGFHRYYTHKSFEAVVPVKAALGILGSMAVEGPVFTWVSRHRRHHQHSDDVDDPHSPHHHGEGVMGVVKGAWHAHVGWLFDKDKPGLDRYIPDITSSKLNQRIDKLFAFWVALSLIIPAIIGGLIMGTWMGVFLGFLWGGLVRVLVVHHITWSINSVCHIWGSQDYKSHDESRNNALFGILAFGEGWHNNHHAFPASARHGLKWWQFDSSYIIIKTLEKVGLVWNVKLPSPEHMAKKALVKAS